MKLWDIYDDLKHDLQTIEEELYIYTSSSDQLMDEAASHLLKAGGKRIRPVLVLLSGKAGAYDLHRIKYVALALELVHMASLVHDDVIDHAETRRGQLTVRTKWDSRIAMYTGNYIFAQAIGSISQLENARIHRILSKSFVDMCVGEIEQIRSLNDWDQSFKTYLLRIKRKTALLMAISCQLGALACQAKEKDVQAMYRYGYFMGMAFQITDDVLDFTGTEEELGKPAGSDLLQGNITLPVLSSFKHEHIRRAIMTEMLQDQPNMSKVIAWVKEGGGIYCSKKIAHQYLIKARLAISGLHDDYCRDTFLQIADFVEQRTY